MKLSKITVSNLIRELNSVMDYDLNIMDETGIIVASTDHTRVGSFHEGALLIIRDNLDELLVSYDNEYEGCREGSNVPLVVDKERIGVLGITGNVTETAKYTRIIQKTAEILLKDYYSLEQSASRDQAKMFFLNSWLNREITDKDRISRKLNQYKCPSSSSWQVIVIDNISGHTVSRNFLNESVISPRTVTGWNNTYGIIIGTFDSCDDAEEYIESLLANRDDRDDFFFAIGDTVHDLLSVPDSYDRALALLQYMRRRRKISLTVYKGIARYSDYMMAIILNGISTEQRDEILETVFGSCHDVNLDDMSYFIIEYCKNNGSINKIADSLFMHKNTVQYKINRIRRLTGLDLRVTFDMLKLLAAAELHLSS